MRVERRIVVNADRDTVWKVLSDPDRYPSFLAHLERWETLTEGPVRVGARYTVLWKIGSIPVGGIAEVVELDTARDLAWINITGVTQRGRFRLRDAGPGRTAVTFRLAYNSEGGLLGLIADRVASRWVGRSLAESLKNLRRLVE
ncbi:SRPBCC family protein [Mycobacterium sp. TY815]|uniref:SRPBCC family protein n=1 Tax=Mycobacterium sp. TY815 TaxID=3050581 RepID=UPI000FB8DA72|nr:SRPBCC family protein [Mycobacterium sp. TY815]MDP7703937.1 SRPBCC family protein [Mycobacterium sp. TY815]RUP03833.1 MAG: SRPBCC family protein [Mycobacterium sp.]